MNATRQLLMSLKPTLTDIIARLRQGRFQNEQAVGRERPPGAPLRAKPQPILRELGWDIFETTLVWPEHQTGESRVDKSLFQHPPAEIQNKEELRCG
jgi:hypothetical protein